MAVQTANPMHPFFGMVLWGDIGDITMYRSHRGKLVIFKKTWPDTPATPPQIAARDGMNCCGRSWRGLAPHQKALWKQLTKKLSLPFSGYNLWVSWRWKQNRSKLRTLQQQAGIQLLTDATTPTVYDPRWRNKPTRLRKNTIDPNIYLMPHSPVIRPGIPCTFWFMPFNRKIPYWTPIAYTIFLFGAGILTEVQMYNQTMIPLIYTPTLIEQAVRIEVTAFWPDGTFNRVQILVQVATT